ncbi:MAG: iron-sulfur cluster insertion protein ErpA [Deltaproteobacteria bacterium]|nr:iron-sulfur cluster insertion protein ErpA [Deltaproteobacteria bacterium]MDZ4224986.1 iron-sulfur cluster insertion protein ErpA [bacterium]
MENTELVSLSEKAVAKIKEYGEKMPEAKGKKFRVYVQGGGCSGFSYGFMFDEKREGDNVIQAGGVDCLVDSQSLMLLKGATVDYVEGLSGAGFSVENPNAKTSCGCGSSFGV